MIPNELVTYLQTRDQQRADRVQDFLDGLTPRELWLLHEAAVMGWVLGARSVPDGWQQPIPKDKTIVASVVASCQSASDLCSVIAGDLTNLVRKIVAQNTDPETGDVIRVVAELARREPDAVESVVQEMVEDGTLIDTDGVLRLASPDTQP
jgi:hypothetical protein